LNTFVTATPAAASVSAVPEVAMIPKPSSAYSRANRDHVWFVDVFDTDEDVARDRQWPLAGELRLGKSEAEIGIDAHDFTSRFHLRA
jgi:hypothetical protein